MSEQATILKLASNVSLFSGIPLTLLEKLLATADKISLRAGQLFFNEGDVGDSFYVLIIGHVAVEQSKNGSWVKLAALHPGDSFGEMRLVDDKVRSARVRATADCVALHFPIARLRNSPEVTSAMYLNIAKVLVKRLKTTNNVVLELTARMGGNVAVDLEEPHPAEPDHPLDGYMLDAAAPVPPIRKPPQSPDDIPPLVIRPPR